MIRDIGEAAFSNTIECVDLKENKLPVCLKILKNNKDYIEQGFDEIKVEFKEYKIGVERVK